jgi:hypothetical protein
MPIMSAMPRDAQPAPTVKRKEEVMRKRPLSLIGLAPAALLVVGGLGGCTSYYKVTDPSTHKEYYTTEVRQDHGATKLRDGRTGSEVTIQNSEVKTITKEEFETGRVR